MQPYQNLNGTSGVVAFEIGADFVQVWFKDEPRAYRYQLADVGRKHLAALKFCARTGRGLSTYISQHRTALPFTRI